MMWPCFGEIRKENAVINDLLRELSMSQFRFRLDSALDVCLSCEFRSTRRPTETT